VHEAIHDDVMLRLADRIRAFRPGLPTDPGTTMGAVISRTQLERILEHIAAAKNDGAHLALGGSTPTDAHLANGFYIEPTVFTGVRQQMRIAREEVFGPVLAVLRWSDHARMIADVNAVPYGLTCSIWTNDLSLAHRTAADVQVGYVWINDVGRHYLGAPFGGVKQSGFGREECLDELLRFTQEKNIHVRLLGASR
jgi:betaine-aldehyde dehydrogenase